jgi:hypothetical protein
MPIPPFLYQPNKDENFNEAKTIIKEKKDELSRKRVGNGGPKLVHMIFEKLLGIGRCKNILVVSPRSEGEPSRFQQIERT